MIKIILILSWLISYGALAEMDPKSVYQMVNKGEAILIDVREEDEIKQGMIKKAHWVALSKMSSNTNWKDDFLALSKGKKIFLYCRSGVRSGKALKILEENSIASENLGGFLTLKEILPVYKPGSL